MGMELEQFYRKNRKAFYIALVYTIICFGFMLTHYMVHIDEETWLLNDVNNNLWLLQNRYLVYLYNLIFTEYGRFVPFFAGIISIILWNLSGLLFAYVFFDFEKKDKCYIRTMLLCYYSSIPFCVGEAFSFSMLIVPEAIGMILVALAFMITVKRKPLKGCWNEICIVLFLTAALGAYQALIGVYVTAVAGWCLCRFLEEKTLKTELWKGIFCCILSVGLYYVINFVIAKSVGAASYLSDNYVGWTNGEGVLFNLFIAMANVGRVSLGITYQDVYIYGGAALRTVMILFILFSVYMFFKKKGALKKAGVLLFTLGIVIAPFALYIALGTYKTQGRMLIALSLSGMIELLLILEYITRKLVEKAAGIVVAGILVVNASKMNQLYYYSYLVYQQDRATAHEIIYDLKRADCDYQNKAVVFIGEIEKEDIGMRSSSTLGGSFFEWDGGNIRRMIDFIKLEGCILHMPSGEQIEEGLALKTNMQIWPLPGSIVETEDSIVIYLSEPGEKWYRTNLGR